jgi:NTP pyrophosphatase (non-canonical NTP hydrolase)
MSSWHVSYYVGMRLLVGDKVDIQEYQRWFAGYDRQRGLDLVEPSQMTVHLMEEVGEVAREVLYLEGYRDPETRSDGLSRLSEELGDVLVFVTKIAQHYDIEMETVMQNVVSKAEGRWPLAEAEREMDRYVAHQQAAWAERAAAWAALKAGRQQAGAGDPQSPPDTPTPAKHSHDNERQSNGEMNG